MIPITMTTAIGLFLGTFCIIAYFVIKYRPDKEPESKLSVREYGTTGKWYVNKVGTAKYYEGYDYKFVEISEAKGYDSKGAANWAVDNLDPDYIW